MFSMQMQMLSNAKIWPKMRFPKFEKKKKRGSNILRYEPQKNFNCISQAYVYQ